MRLTINDRQWLEALLPTSGSVLDMVAADSIRKRVAITVEDFERVGAWEVEDENGKKTGEIKYRTENDTGVDFDFSRMEMDMLREVYRKADEEKRVTRDSLGFFLKLRDLG